ncbi:MAG: hypothetical protein JW798_11485 [Prolixibacteraceae bacterium]|nr:hypothetical protein [Prolixibacteraceae bacterium]
MKKNLVAILALMAVVSLMLFWIFKPIVLHPNSYMFQKSGDAIKSYYNFSYMLKYDKGIKHDGINYPYSEHAQFDNTHPLHLAVFNQLDKLFPVSHYGVGIINLSMILSIILAVPFIFLILRRYKLPVWYSFLITLIILFLSPQLDRMRGHFEMAYVFFIPMLWYLLLKFNDGEKKWLWGAFLVLLGLAGGFTSAYFVAFYAIFLFAYIVSVLWINQKNIKLVLKSILILFLLAIIPLLAVRGFSMATDWVTDRPDNPYGFYYYHANIFSIFLPFEQLMKLLPWNFYNKLHIRWEGEAFVGLPAALLAVYFFWMILRNFYTRRKIAPIFSESDLNPFLLGAFLVLLFSMCFPFKWGLGILADIIPSLRQFRALGRFAWIFYFVFTIYSAAYIYRLFIKMISEGQKTKAIWIMVLALSFWSYDAIAHSEASFRGTINSNDKLESSDEDYARFLDESNIDPEKYQAIFFMPFANTTGDKFQFERGMDAFGEAMKCSYHTRLPLLQSYSPRLSFSNALSSVQILADSCIRKTRFNDMNEKPLLLICTNERLMPEEQWLKDHSTFLYSNQWISISEFTPELLQNKYKSWKTWADSVTTTLEGKPDFKSNVDLEKIYYLDFDDMKSKIAFHGDGALFKRRKKVEVFDENFSEKGMTGNYELSFWLYFDTRTYSMPWARINVKDKYGLIVETIELNTMQEHNVFDRWVRIDQLLDLTEGMTYQLEIEGRYITIDDLLMKPAHDCYVLKKYSGGVSMFNNYPLNY